MPSSTKHNLKYLGLSVILGLLNITLAYGSVFEYPRDANYVVIEYTVSQDMILDADPIPLLRIFGNDRVLVHYPVYMKLAGDYEMQLSDAELQQLLNSIEQKGLLSFNSNKVLQLKQLALSKSLASNKLIPTERTDGSHSQFTIKLSSYQSTTSGLLQADVNKTIKLKDLTLDAQAHPNITALTNAASAEQELGQFLTHKNLVKIK